MTMYAIRTDLEARFGADEIRRLLGDCPTDADDDADATRRLEAVLTDASAEIDAVLARAYDLPLAAASYPILAAIACDLARARLYDDVVPDAVSAAATRAREQLEALAGDDAALVDGAGALVARRVTAPVTRADPPVMARHAARHTAGWAERC